MAKQTSAACIKGVPLSHFFNDEIRFLHVAEKRLEEATWYCLSSCSKGTTQLSVYNSMAVFIRKEQNDHMLKETGVRIISS